MDPAFLNARFFKHCDPARWEDELCADLAPALRLLLTEPGNAIASMGLENVKMPDLTVILKHPPSPRILAEVETLCAISPGLVVKDGSVVCFDHYHAIEWSVPAPPPPPASPPQKRPSLLKRLFG